MAAEGVRLTSFYSASGVCTPSRAALMTGCYPRRVGLHKTDPDGAVLRPVSPNGLALSEVTIAEVLKTQGYATTCIGKWHLGDQAELLPTRQGFDSFFGMLFSNDQGEPVVWRDRQIIDQHPIDQTTLTRRYTEQAVAFIEENREQPFFLYLPFTSPHAPIVPTTDFCLASSKQSGLHGIA